MENHFLWIKGEEIYLHPNVGIIPSFYIQITLIFFLKVRSTLIEKNLKIPKDVSVIGYDDLKITYFLKPSLTTVKQPNTKIGKIAAKILLNNIKDKPNWKPQIVRLKPKLIIRDSA